MKLTMTKVLTPLAALAFSFGVQGAVSTETFDTYTAGETVITNQTGWSFTYGTDGADDASAITAYDNDAPTTVPDGMSAGANYLKLSTEDGILFRNMDGTASGNSVDLNTGLFVDTDVQFTITDKSDRPEVTEDDKFIIWLEADEDAGTTNLCVWAREFTYANSAASVTSNKVYTLVKNTTGTLDITPGAWYRLTVKALPSASAGSFSFPAFQVYLDNVQLRSDEYIADDVNTFVAGVGDADDVVANRLYFPAIADEMTSLTKVGFSGEGALDCVAITRDVPAFDNPTVLTFNWDTSVITSIDISTLGASLTTSGSTLSVYPGQTFTMTLNYADGCSASTHTLTTASSATGYATVADLAVTAVATGAATITLTTTAKDTVDVTFEWGSIVNVMVEAGVQELSAITFTVGDGDPIAGDIVNSTEKKISGLKVGTNVTVTVTYTAGATIAWATTITPASCMSLSGTTLTINSRPDSGTATVTISAAAAVAKIGDTSYATLAEAVAAVADSTATTIQLVGAVTAGDVAIAANKNVTIDLNGQTITGAAEAGAVFAVAADGTLTITNSAASDGYVLVGSATACISNAGTLNLQAGKFNGTISGGTINVTGGAYTADIAGAVCPAGYSLQQNAGAGDAYVYQLMANSYTIAYYYDATLLDLAPATYTYGAGATLPQSAGEVTGKTFVGWYDNAQLTGDAVTAIATTDTGNKTFYAKYDTATVTVTFNANNNEATGTMAAQSIDYNTATALTANGFALSGHTFSGWATASDGEVVYADQASVTLTADITLYAVWTSSGSVYPTYLQDADQTVKTQYDNWKQTYGADTQSAYEAAFLLNVDPNSGDTTLDTSAVTINGTTVTLTTDHTSFNGYVYVKAASTLAGLDSATPTRVTPENGVITLTGQSGTAAFYKIIVSATEIAE